LIGVVVLAVGLVAALTVPTRRDADAVTHPIVTSLPTPGQGPPETPAGPTPTPAAPKLTWSDEFNAVAGAPVDRRRWGFDLGVHGWSNNERQYYTDSTANAAHDGQGNLVITARRGNPTGAWCAPGPCEFTSARLTTQHTFSQAYGRFEARMRVPGGQGTWPAFWMMGDDFGRTGWPGSGEIDVMEHVGKQPRTVHGTVHGPGYSGEQGPGSSRSAATDLAADFHTYRVDWAPGLIVWYLDGAEYARLTPKDVGGDRWVFDHPFFLLLNLAVGGDWPGRPHADTAFPRSLYVDYVRVWAYQPPAPPPAPSPTPSPAPPVGPIPTSVRDSVS
jgi:beta-glucanase (GH16 family)